MRPLLLAFCFLCLRGGDLRSQQASQGGNPPLVRGSVSDATASRQLSGVSILIVSLGNPSWREVAVTDEAGRFEVRVDRRGTFRLSARRPGYVASELSVQVTSDTTVVAMALTPVAQPLPEVAVLESEIDLFVRDLRTAYRAVNRSRVFDARQMDSTGQMLTGPFVLGQAGVVPVPCKRSSQFLPPGKVRTQPVERELADIWYPCYLDRGKPRSILVRIDGGPIEPFDAIGNRALTEFAAIAIVGGGIVVAYTKDYATRLRSMKQKPQE